MALKSSRGSDFSTSPWSSQPSAGFCGSKMGVGHEADRAGVPSEGRERIVEIDVAAVAADRRRPDIVRLEAEDVGSPFRHALADRPGVLPDDPVRRGLHPDRAARRPLLAGAEGGEPAVDLDHRRVVDAGVAGQRRLRLGGAGGRATRRGGDARRGRKPRRRKECAEPSCGRGTHSARPRGRQSEPVGRSAPPIPARACRARRPSRAAPAGRGPRRGRGPGGRPP